MATLALKPVLFGMRLIEMVQLDMDLSQFDEPIETCMGTDEGIVASYAFLGNPNKLSTENTEPSQREKNYICYQVYIFICIFFERMNEKSAVLNSMQVICVSFHWMRYCRRRPWFFLRVRTCWRLIIHMNQPIAHPASTFQHIRRSGGKETCDVEKIEGDKQKIASLLCHFSLRSSYKTSILLLSVRAISAYNVFIN